MKNWEKALAKFIANWEKRQYVVGAIVCGSYVTGRPSRHSDIDIQIFLDKAIGWRERGNEIVDGFLMEYFANPLPQNLEYFREDFESRRKYNIHMFTSGRVLFDKKGDVARLIREAKKWDKKKFNKPGKVVLELDKYHLWDLEDNLEEIYESGNHDFHFVYYTSLKSLFESYSKFLGYHSIPDNKLLRFLTDRKDQKKYRMPDFPDKKFSALLADALKIAAKDKMMAKYNNLNTHVMHQMGGFEIDGWKIRSKAK